MKEQQTRGMNLKEAAEILGVRKGQAIMMAEAGWLTFINDGANGKEKTVTFDSVFGIKRKGKTQEALASAKAYREKTARIDEPQPVPSPAPAEAPAPDLDALLKKVGELVAGVNALVSETRQLKGIVCAKLRVPASSQPEFELK